MLSLNQEEIKLRRMHISLALLVVETVLEQLVVVETWILGPAESGERGGGSMAPSYKVCWDISYLERGTVYDNPPSFVSYRGRVPVGGRKQVGQERGTKAAIPTPLLWQRAPLPASHGDSA